MNIKKTIKEEVKNFIDDRILEEVEIEITGLVDDSSPNLPRYGDRLNSISENDNWYDINPKLEILRSYIHILKNSQKEYELAITYFIILHNFLIIERMFYDDIKEAGKEINKHLNVEKLNNEQEVYQKFLELYDINSPVRFAVETLDSIDSVNQYLEKNPQIYQSLLVK